MRTPRRPVYPSRVISALELCSRLARAPAGKRLAPMLPVLVPMLRRDGELDLTDSEAELPMEMSAATIDRRLQGTKVLAEFRGRSHTMPGARMDHVGKPDLFGPFREAQTRGDRIEAQRGRPALASSRGSGQGGMDAGMGRFGGPPMTAVGRAKA